MRAEAGTARRYAKALYEVAAEAGAAAGTGEELGRLRAALEGAPEAGEVLGRAWIKPADRRAIAVKVAEKAGCGATVRNLAGLLAERGRIDHLPAIEAVYRALVDEAEGRARAQVRTAAPLTEEEKRALAERLGRALGKRIVVEEQVDRTLLGGFVAQVGSFILDGSLDGQLLRMRERLARG